MIQLTPMGWPNRFAKSGFRGYPQTGQPRVILEVTSHPLYSVYTLKSRDGRLLLRLMIDWDGRATDFLAR